MVRPVISRSDAARQGMKRYYTGRPCGKSGHDAERYVCDKKCCECGRIKQANAAACNPEEKRRREREYYAENKERMRRLIRRRGRRYYANHLEQERARSKAKPYSLDAVRRYFARRRKATPLLSTEERAQIRWLYAEARRLTAETGIPHNVDHIIPLIRGGLHHPSNMQVITEQQNLRKGSWLPHELEVEA